MAKPGAKIGFDSSAARNLNGSLNGAEQPQDPGKGISKPQPTGAWNRGEQPLPPGAGNSGEQQQPPRARPAGSDMVLARFLRVCTSILSAPMPQEAAALVVNRVAEITRVDRAVLVRLSGKSPIAAVTGGGQAAQDSGFADAIDAARDAYGDRQEPMILPPAQEGPIQKVQSAMGGTGILWLPLWLDRDGKIPPAYALWLERWRGLRWDDSLDVELLRHAALFMGHGLARPRSAALRSRKRIIRSVAGLVLLLVLALPVTSSVTAPLRAVPDRPHYIFAPMDGILKELLVQPGQRVAKDTVLFRYDARVLDKRLDEAYRNVAVARAKLAKLEGAAHRDREARAELPVQRLEVERAEADVEFFARQRARAEVKTVNPGVIVLDDPDAIIGAALQTGQAVMSVAEPDKTKVRIMVPASDVGFLKEGARVGVRLDSDPLRTIPAVITRLGFDVMVSEDQIPSVMAEAVWVGDPPEVQPGQKGSAKIYGDSTILGMQILRKPIITVRSFIGL